MTHNAGRAFARHRLHDPQRCWPETNCYVDLWIELLSSLGQTPEAGLGFTVAQGFEEDQFGFSKFAIDDLRVLYGLDVRELSIYRTLEQHARTHLGRGGVVLIEVDAFHLPDTAATSYRRTHAKTTIAVDTIDAAARTCGYFHNAARGVLAGEDYLGAFRLDPDHDPDHASKPAPLPPYVELVTRPAEPRPPASLRQAALDLLGRHLSRAPRRNPFSAWRDAFGAHLEELLSAPSLFHDYAFHFPRLAGSNFELLGDHAAWLAADELRDAVEACRRVARQAKVLQFRLARSVARRRADPCAECFDELERGYEHAIRALSRYAPC